MGGMINIHVEAFFSSPLNYNNSNVQQATVCGDTDLQRNIKYNDLSGDFVVGKDFTNTAGFPAQTLTILGFTDEAYFLENSTQNQTPAPGFVPRRLKNITTNTIISTFPTDIAVSNLNQLGMELGAQELICPSDTVNYTGIRVRLMTYRLVDSNGNLGPTKTARFANVPQ